jgi:Ca-activated chloride channel family protein
MMRALPLGLALALVACWSGPDLAPAPTVATADLIRGRLTLERDGQSEPVRRSLRVERGATAATADDGRAALRVDNGAWILLDRASRFAPSLTGGAAEAGRVWVDVTAAEETTITTAYGEISASDATFAVELSEGRAFVYCASGELTYRAGEAGDRIPQGVAVVLAPGAAPEERDVDLWDDWTGGLADPSRRRDARSGPLGSLSGRRVTDVGLARTALPIRDHRVDVVFRGDLAETTVEQTFFNARSDVLEGEWTVRLPPGAIVRSFAVDTGGGGFQEARPSALRLDGGGYGLSWGDAASRRGSRLVYAGPDELRARIFPVDPGGQVRVRLTYTQWLDREGPRRTYVYPMAVEGDPPQIAEFRLEVETAGTVVDGLRAGLGARVEGSRVRFAEGDFRPRADFVLDLYAPTERPDGEVLAYTFEMEGDQGGGPAAEGRERYVLLDIGTDGLFEEDAEVPPLDLVLLLDVSGDTDPEDLEVARSVVEAVLRQVAPTDRVALRVADVHARVPEGGEAGLVEATPENREAFLDAIARVHLGGATDLGESLREAGELVAGRPRGAVLYLGDGIPTTGALDATSLRRTLATLEAAPRYFGLALGDGANLGLLRRLFDGQATAVAERTTASRAVMGLLAEAARPTVRGVEVALGEPVERVYPRAPLLVREGENLHLVGRLIGDLPDAITLRGIRDGEAVEVPLTVVQSYLDDGGDVRRRWATYRLGELVDEDAGREALVDLGLRFGLVSPFTSLVVGGGGDYLPVRGFDLDPFEVAYGLGGGTTAMRAQMLSDDPVGWRRRRGASSFEPATAPEQTWVSRVSPLDEGPAPTGDGGFAAAAVNRRLREGERGPRTCYDRRSLVAPNLAGQVTVAVDVGADGDVREVRVVRSTVRDPDLEGCVRTEIGGLRFPATGRAVTGEHTLTFALPEREFGRRRQCSEASTKSLETRRDLWRERLAQRRGTLGSLEVWRQARRTCELPNWRSRRTLLREMLRVVGGIRPRLALFQAFQGSPDIARYLRRVILRQVRTPEDVIAARAGLGIDVPIDWSLFSRAYKRDDDPARRLELVRRWLNVAPEEMDLRLRLLALLEETGGLPEARRLARELRGDPLADARVRTVVGEFWLRQGDEAEARRVFSELVERTPLDPWARRRLGDVYRAQGWADDAYREYRTLSRLRPGDRSVLLLWARAAADAGRIDEALRLEQRLSESTAPELDEGVAGAARSWTLVRLARLTLDAEDDATRAEIRRRSRLAGVLRDPPALFVALTWSHPDDTPELRVRFPRSEHRGGRRRLRPHRGRRPRPRDLGPPHRRAAGGRLPLRGPAAGDGSPPGARGRARRHRGPRDLGGGHPPRGAVDPPGEAAPSLHPRRRRPSPLTAVPFLLPRRTRAVWSAGAWSPFSASGTASSSCRASPSPWPSSASAYGRAAARSSSSPSWGWAASSRAWWWPTGWSSERRRRPCCRPPAPSSTAGPRRRPRPASTGRCLPSTRPWRRPRPCCSRCSETRRTSSGP